MAFVFDSTDQTRGLIVPRLMQDIIHVRRETKDALAQCANDTNMFALLKARDAANKRWNNSFYGTNGQKGTDTSNILLAAALTARGREMLNALRHYLTHSIQIVHEFTDSRRPVESSVDFCACVTEPSSQQVMAIDHPRKLLLAGDKRYLSTIAAAAAAATAMAVDDQESVVRKKYAL